MKANWKIIGLIATVLGAATSVVGSIADGNKTAEMIKNEAAKAVADALANKN
jgi:hypothetical protein